MGAVHDLTALYISLRNDGRSIGDITGKLLGPRERTLFLLLIFFLLSLAMSAFYPEAVFPAWALFGISNQLLGALGFLVMTLWFYRAGRPFAHLMLPMFFMMAITLVALPYSLWQFVQADPVSWPLLGTGIAILGLDLWLIAEAVMSLGRLCPERQARGKMPAQASAVPDETA